MLREDLRIPSVAGQNAQEAVGGSAQAPRTPEWLLPTMVVAFVVALALGMFLGSRSVGPLRQQLLARDRLIAGKDRQLEEQAQQLAVQEEALAQMSTSCDDGGQARAQVSGFLGKGQLELAVGLVEATLAQQSPPLCAEARAALAGLWYGASMDRLFSTPRPDWPGSQVEGQLVERWREIEGKAATYQVPQEGRWAPMTVAIRAYNAGLWALTDAAFRRAWMGGEVGAQAIQFRYDSLRNWGYHLAHGGGADERERAVRILATARAIADAFQLPKGEACQDLVVLGYADCREPLPDPQEPVLADSETA